MEASGAFKIFNDPVHGFIEVPKNIILRIIDHPYFQRLRRIRQTGLSSLIYPGCVHTRFSHALGAMHLTKLALKVLKEKGIHISDDEFTATLLAILLHDIGHGPFSHALENVLIPRTAHEEMSLLLMQRLNEECSGALTGAIDIFTRKGDKPFLHELISGQLDMDRMDYLIRDSFFTGVIEGIIGTERIIHTLNVRNEHLVVEEKGIWAVEKFIIARRLMYWQVYLHKTSVIAEYMLIQTLTRAREVYLRTPEKLFTDETLKYFFEADFSDPETLIRFFTRTDDSDILYALKKWEFADDPVLSELCSRILNRKLLKIEIDNQPFDQNRIADLRLELAKTKRWSEADSAYFIFSGQITNRAYLPRSTEPILILKKDGSVADLAKVSDLIEIDSVSRQVVKYFLIRPE